MSECHHGFGSTLTDCCVNCLLSVQLVNCWTTRMRRRRQIHSKPTNMATLSWLSCNSPQENIYHVISRYVTTLGVWEIKRSSNHFQTSNKKLGLVYNVRWSPQLASSLQHSLWPTSGEGRHTSEPTPSAGIIQKEHLNQLLKRFQCNMQKNIST